MEEKPVSVNRIPPAARRNTGAIGHGRIGMGTRSRFVVISSRSHVGWSGWRASSKRGRSALFKTEIAYFIGKPASEPLGHGTKRWHKGSSQTILCASVGRLVGYEVVLSAYTKHAGGDALTLIMDGLTAEPSTFFLYPRTSILNNVRRTGNSSLPRRCYRFGLRREQAPNTARNFFARFEGPSARGVRRSMSTASSGQTNAPAGLGWSSSWFFSHLRDSLLGSDLVGWR